MHHLDGTPFRKLANQYHFSHMTAYRKCMQALESLPHCADLTRNYCNKFSGILLVDGKFIKINNYEYKLPVIYCIDYLTHDIPTFVFAPSENYHAIKKLFLSLRLLNYPLQSLVSDDNLNFPKACFDVYPNANWQLCTNHFKENIRNTLGVRTNPTYRPFMQDLETLLRPKRSFDDFNNTSVKLLHKYKSDSLCTSIMLDIARRTPNLTAYLKVKHTPKTNNLIECFNSHLNGRLKTIKGFESFSHAQLWLNGYFIRRRTTPFTDCTGKFKHLNGFCSIEKTAKQDVNIPTFF